MPVSIRIVNVGLAFFCILVTGFLCTFLTAQSGDKALDDTKDSRETNVDRAFHIGEANVKKRTTELLRLASKGVDTQMIDWFKLPITEAEALTSLMTSQPENITTTWDYMWGLRGSVYQHLKALRHHNVLGCGLQLDNHMNLAFFETFLTVQNPPDGLHIVTAQVNNGTDYDADAGMSAAQRTYETTMAPEDTGDLYMYPQVLHRYETPNRSAEEPACVPFPLTSFVTKNQIRDLPCRLMVSNKEPYLPWGVTDLFQAAIANGGRLYPGLPTQPIEFNKPFFTGAALLGSFVGGMVASVIRHPSLGNHVGLAYIGLEMRLVSRILGDIASDIGGPVQHPNGTMLPSRGRVYITSRSHAFSMTGQPFSDEAAGVGMLVAASHGLTQREVGIEPGTEALGYYPFLGWMPAQNSTDPIVAGAGAFVDSYVNHTARALVPEAMQSFYTNWSTSKYEELTKNAEPTSFDLATDRSPEGEAFFLQVSRLDNQRGIDWHVTVLVDRESMLGEIDATIVATRAAIAAESKMVDDDLEAARAVLFGVIGAIAVVLLAISVVTVLQITKPLVTLQEEMAYVAIMALEHVDTKRPLSALSEVRCMQESFLQMIQNLVEYRNYMPASVLLNDEEDDESIDQSVSVAKTQQTQGSVSASKASKASMSSQKSQSMVLAAKTNLKSMELKNKRVCLALINVVDFLAGVGKGGHTKALAERHTTYLSVVLERIANSKGLPDFFNGDRVWASWNGAKNVSAAREQATTCVVDIKNLCQSHGAEKLMLSMSIAFGDAKTGNMGVPGMKKFNIVGAVASWVNVQERLNKVYGTTILVDHAVHEEVGPKSTNYFVDHVEANPKHGSKGKKVYEVLAMKDLGEEEWMYQLEEGEAMNPYRLVNEAVQHSVAGRYTEALDAVRQADQNLTGVQGTVQRIEQAVARGAHALPELSFLKYL